jgi:hypothetical protein
LPQKTLWLVTDKNIPQHFCRVTAGFALLFLDFRATSKNAAQHALTRLGVASA